MIVMDEPQVWNAKYGPSSHMLSDLHGDEGRKELLAMALLMGLPAKYLQKAGTEREHFDLFKGALRRAKLMGIKVVTREELVAIIHAKRAVLRGP